MAYIRQRQATDGPRYDVRYIVNGNRRTETFRAKRDADARLRQVRSEELGGTLIDPRHGERLFGDYADDWLETRLANGKPLTPATKQGYKALLRRHLRPAFGQTHLRRITTERVRKWHDTLAAQQSDQAAKAYRLLRAILNTAVSDQLITRNPCMIKGAGIEHTAERPMLDIGDVLNLAEVITPRLKALIYVAGFVALRPGELLGLQRADIDLLHRTLKVQRQAHEIVGQGHVLTGPKTEAGNREVAFPAVVADVLSEHLDAYVAAEPIAPVFTRPSGRPLRRQDLSNEWRAACAALGLSGVRPHDLRHHALTLAAHAPDVTTKEVMAMAGHASPVAALRYQHATLDRSHGIASFVDGVIMAVRQRAGVNGGVRAIHAP